MKSSWRERSYENEWQSDFNISLFRNVLWNIKFTSFIWWRLKRHVKVLMWRYLGQKSHLRCTYHEFSIDFLDNSRKSRQSALNTCSKVKKICWFAHKNEMKWLKNVAVSVFIAKCIQHEFHSQFPLNAFYRISWESILFIIYPIAKTFSSMSSWTQTFLSIKRHSCTLVLEWSASRPSLHYFFDIQGNLLGMWNCCHFCAKCTHWVQWCSHSASLFCHRHHHDKHTTEQKEWVRERNS